MRFADFLRITSIGLILTVGTTACSSPSESEDLFTDDPQSREAFELIRDAESSVLRAAFDSLSTRPFTVESRIEQQAPDANTPVAVRSYTVRYDPDGAESDRRTVVRGDSSGTFELGMATGLLGGRPQPATSGNPFLHLLPNQPTYASSSGPGLYEYRLLPDTSIGERRAVGALARLESGAGDETVQSVRLFVEPESNEILFVKIVRHQEALLFEEESTASASVERTSDGTWVPEQLEARMTVRIPFTEPRTLYTQRRYSTL